MTASENPPRRPRSRSPGKGNDLVQGFGRFLLLGASLGLGIGGLVTLLASRIVAVTLVGGGPRIASDAFFGSGRLDDIANLITVGLIGAGVIGLAAGVLLLVLFVLELVRDAREPA